MVVHFPPTHAATSHSGTSSVQSEATLHVCSPSPCRLHVEAPEHPFDWLHPFDRLHPFDWPHPFDWGPHVQPPNTKAGNDAMKASL